MNSMTSTNLQCARITEAALKLSVSPITTTSKFTQFQREGSPVGGGRGSGGALRGGGGGEG